MIYAKALTDDDRSDSIIVSFDASWRQKILGVTFSAILRKRVPMSAMPSRIYFHINAPFSEVLARARIGAIKVISKQDAVKLHRKLDLSADKITAYIGNDSQIGAYLVDEFEVSDKNVTTRLLQEHMAYSPPQSFLFLSHDGKTLVDRLCNFRPISDLKRGSQRAK